MPFMEGTSDNLALSSSTLVPSLDTTAFMAPFSRMCVTKARVSTSRMPTTSWLSRSSCNVPLPPGRLATDEKLRATTPATRGPADSVSPSWTP